jgi:translation elongation factor P/translation initiation factor 5A
LRTETITYLKQNAAELDLQEPLIVTQNGKPKYVIETYEAKANRDEAIAMLKLLAFAGKDVREGRIMSGDNVRSTLRKRLKRE